MKAGYLQFKPSFGKPEVNIRRIRELISDKDFDLLVLPELANSGYLFSSADELQNCSEEIPDGPFCSALQKICTDKNAYIVSGICEKYSGKFYNSAILVRPDGKIITYRKIHLYNDEKLWFEPGNIYLQAQEINSESFGAVNIGMMICYDWFYPETARTLAMKGAQIICHPSNLVMPYCQNAMYTRAIENRVFTITANRIGRESNKEKELEFTGGSVIVSPFGEYLSRASVDKEECCIIDIDHGLALDKTMNPHNNIFNDRREEFYFD
jgi:predicted amidohydrolase